MAEPKRAPDTPGPQASTVSYLWLLSLCVGLAIGAGIGAGLGRIGAGIGIGIGVGVAVRLYFSQRAKKGPRND